MKRLILSLFTVCFLVALCSCNILGTQSKNENTLDLSGKWAFKLDPNDEGIKENWAVETLSDTIKLPGTTDEGGYGPLGPQTPDRIGVLTRRHEYLGAAWYSREITVPTDWAGKDVELYLERVMWQTQVWVDGKKLSSVEDSLCVPHIHNLGKLTPGTHKLTVRIDNRMIHPIGNKNHGYGEQTQSRWNGAVGRIELIARPNSRVEAVRVFTELDGSTRFEVKNSGDLAGVEVRGSVVDQKTGKVLGVSKTVAAEKLQNVSFKSENPTLWSEFTPKTYQAKVELVKDGEVLDTKTSVCGFYKFSREGNKLFVNGEPAYMRGNLDCVHFVRTGYPSPYKEDWIKIFKIYQKHNLNHVRFHSWCPPKAAFEAADELGIYMQPEGPIWIDWWMTKPMPHRPGMETEAYPQGIGKNDRTIDQFARAEFKRILDEYGNHPSFMYFCFGNELGTSNFKETGKWVKEYKEYDPRHLHAASTARTITEHCEFNATHAVPGVGWVRQHYEFGTNWDYEEKFRKTTVPIISHEIGQWPIYPEWDIIDKFDGVLRNTHLERMRNEAKANGVFDDQKEFTRSSGAVNQRMYKDEIEGFLRTPSCRGFQLLQMQDFQGQGEAYIGWLDCFWDDKGTTDIDAFRGYCAPVVALAKLKSYVYIDGQKFDAGLLVRNDSGKAIKGRKLTVVLKDSKGQAIATESFTFNAANGEVVNVGTFTTTMKTTQATRLNLELILEGKEEKNSYPLWVYPKTLPEVKHDIVEASYFDPEVIEALNQGKSVLLNASQIGDESAKKNANWRPLYWSVPFFPGQGSDTLGLVVRDEHPAYSNFPTEYFNDWNWYRLCWGARGFDLTGKVPVAYKPIAQPVTDFHINKKLGSIFELKVGKGKLLVSGYNLKRQEPEMKQLKYSLLKYMTSDKFNPKQTLPTAELEKMFYVKPVAPVVVPKGFEKALFYVKAGARLRESGGKKWNKSYDSVPVAKGVSYKVKADGVYKDNVGTAWHGKNIEVDFKVPDGILADIYIHLHDWNNQGREGTIMFEGREYKLGKHAGKGKWVKLMVMREDANDGKLNLKTVCTKSNNLMITAIAIVPKL